MEKFLIFATVACFIYASSGAKRCRDDEEPIQCPTTCPCDKSCSPRPHRICGQMITQQCACRYGKFRDDATGRCLFQFECPKTGCRADEESMTCPTTCPCDDPCKPRPPVICAQSFTQQCGCRKGTFRDDETGRCLSRSQCPGAGCRDDEEPIRCLTSCPCDKPCKPRPPMSCLEVITDQCGCRNGTYRDDDTQQCLQPYQCPGAECRDDEEPIKCPTTCPCDEPCKPRPPRICAQVETDQCGCRDDTLRDDATGRCLPPSECPGAAKECKCNEVMMTCPSACRCDEPCRPRKPVYCAQVITKMCGCPEGSCRDDRTGECFKYHLN